MRRIFTGAALAASLSVFSIEAVAASTQPDEPDGDLILEDDDDGTAPPATPQASESSSGPADDSFLDEDIDLGIDDAGSAAPGPGPASKPGSAPGEGEDDIEIDQDALDEKMITVVSHQPMLNVFYKDGEKKVLRFEITPQVGISVNDPYVRHYAAGGEINLWLTNRMALGASATAFIGQVTPNYNEVRFQQGILLTANRYLWQASLSYLYEPFYGKIAVFNRVLLHWESYVQIGGGVIQSRVIPRYEALHEPFTSIIPQGNFAVGARLYVPGAEFFSFNLGVRTHIFQDRLEPLRRGPNTVADQGEDPESLDDPGLSDAGGAKAKPMKRLAYNAVFFLGLSFHLPPTFTYSTRR